VRVRHNPNLHPDRDHPVKLQTTVVDWKDEQKTLQIGPEMKRIRKFKENTLPMPMAAYGVEAKH